MAREPIAIKGASIAILPYFYQSISKHGHLLWCGAAALAEVLPLPDEVLLMSL
jgi:hypothetical protein